MRTYVCLYTQGLGGVMRFLPQPSSYEYDAVHLAPADGALVLQVLQELLILAASCTKDDMAARDGHMLLLFRKANDTLVIR